MSALSANGVEGGDQEVDVPLRGDQGWGQADGLAVRLLGEDAMVEQLLAEVSTGRQLGADIDARPQSTRAHFVFLGQHDQAHRRLDPGQVIVHRLHAGHILGRDDKRVARPIVGDHPPKTDHAIAHHDIDVRRPWLLGTFV